jgi:flavin reductase (DIM6/NTAB) family NADH-FMN oxidoreductase RutF
VNPTEDAFEHLVGRLDHSMFVVTASVGDTQAGCLVGFATQGSIDPPRLVVFISKQNQTYQLAREAASLAVHVLGQENAELARLFGEETGDEIDKFSLCEWEPGPHGVPLLSSCAGVIVGSVLGGFDAGDHVGYLLEPTFAEVNNRSFEPLTNQQVRCFEPGHPA